MFRDEKNDSVSAELGSSRAHSLDMETAPGQPSRPLLSQQCIRGAYPLES